MCTVYTKSSSAERCITMKSACKSGSGCLVALHRSVHIWGRKAERPETLPKRQKGRQGNSGNTPQGKPMSKHQLEKAVLLAVKWCPFVWILLFLGNRLGVFTDEEIEDISVSITSLSSQVKQHIKLCESSKWGQIYMQTNFCNLSPSLAVIQNTLLLETCLSPRHPFPGCHARPFNPFCGEQVSALFLGW